MVSRVETLEQSCRLGFCSNSPCKTWAALWGGEIWQGIAKGFIAWGEAYNGSDSDTVYMAREDGCACRSTLHIRDQLGGIWGRLKEQTAGEM